MFGRSMSSFFCEQLETFAFATIVRWLFPISQSNPRIMNHAFLALRSSSPFFPFRSPKIISPSTRTQQPPKYCFLFNPPKALTYPPPSSLPPGPGMESASQPPPWPLRSDSRTRQSCPSTHQINSHTTSPLLFLLLSMFPSLLDQRRRMRRIRNICRVTFEALYT